MLIYNSQIIVIDEFYMPLSSLLSQDQLDTLFSNIKGISYFLLLCYTYLPFLLFLFQRLLLYTQSSLIL